jgi:hypothetical protein
MRYHLVVTGSRPEKGPDGKFLPMPEENVAFIKKVLSAVKPEEVVAIYHGMAAGVDAVADQFAYDNRIRVRQYPAYWRNMSKPNNFDSAAGFFRNERMVRDAKQNVWVPDGQTATEEVVILGFHNKPLADSKGTAHCVSLGEKLNVTTRTFPLPVQVAQPAEATTGGTTSDPFQF